MRILIARPQLFLPWRVQQEMDHDEQFNYWRRRLFMTMATSLAVAGLYALALYLALHGAGDWTAIPAALSSLPLVWLVDKAAFENAPVFEEPEPEISDLPQLILP